MTPEQALSILSQFRLQASGTNLSGRDFDMSALALQVLSEAVKAIPKPIDRGSVTTLCDIPSEPKAE